MNEAQRTNSLSLSSDFSWLSPSFCRVHVQVPAPIVEAFFHQAALCQQRLSTTQGFARGNVPLAYIKEHFNSDICEHIQNLLLKYSVTSYLYQTVREKEILLSGQPRISSISLTANHPASFSFDLSVFPSLQISEWKYFPFKAPRRKNYKDLDRQVETFLTDEEERLARGVNTPIKPGDWVNFTATLCTNEQSPVVEGLSQNFWFKIGDDETESALREAFEEKHVGDIFYTRNRGLQEYFGSKFETDYTFKIEITDHVANTFFCVEQFKKYFRLKTQKDVHKKLIEVFSYRNDLSQRRAMVEESLKLMLSRHHFEIPNYIILRQQKTLLETVRLNPDYNVYRVQKDFRHRIRQLAEKVAREEILIDRLAYHEKIEVGNSDVRQYLNLTNRPRTKEFIYFDIPTFKVQGQEVPILSEELKRLCLREKAINHAIYHLTKK